MMYKVVSFFTDLQDGEHAYNPGDTFPRKGVEVSAERISELASPNNLQGIKLIEAVEEKKTEGIKVTLGDTDEKPRRKRK